ncbi:CDP-diacylglycerol--inositol 3-phosphatidyltransferase 1 [Dorcoceras hygrometricum]|uniref:CDP-diacylglycerol--inositol 3-phosphatidyltransferase 1 n=1 Tax=Dorcoceras hygrometricum TaxID=472368 RepID=A0A2Z7BXB9_9LAMI|nr:CDP-diacylglycerol--inositol 3-phosphatidyltransferase 1 [Dorcoceras hygrometricum]
MVTSCFLLLCVGVVFADVTIQISQACFVVIVAQKYKLLSVLGFDPMSLWGLVVFLAVLFSGNPGFTAGRGFNPAGGAPGGG